jgi:haloacid dehalogenase-like hydrolase
MNVRTGFLVTLCCALASCTAPQQATRPDAAPASPAAATDPLPSWNEGAARTAILDFVERTTRQGPDFVSPSERIAVFDNDGTLWAEQPMYFQLVFALDRIKSLAPKHQEWKMTQPFKGVIEGDIEAVLARGAAGLTELVAASHAGVTTGEFEQIVTDWIAPRDIRKPGAGTTRWSISRCSTC